MSGVFTSKRNTQTVYQTTYTNTVGTKLNGPDESTTTDQTTTSFRTGRPQANSDHDLQAKWLAVTENAFNRRDPVDTGHAFITTKRSSFLSHTDWFCKDTDTLVSRQGALRPSITGVPFDFPNLTPMSSNEITLYGNRAIKATAPTRPAAALATTIGELFRDGIPDLSVVNSAISNSNKHSTKRGSIDWSKPIDSSLAGSEFLNYEFGWVPLVSGMNQLMQAVLDSYNVIQQYVRDGQPGLYVRRRFDFEPEATVTSTLMGTGTISLHGLAGYLLKPGAMSGPITRVDTVSKKRWFTGAYSYYVSVDKNMLARMERYAKYANKLLGTFITPEVLWELAPWSWLVDWKLDVSTAVSNATRFQSDDLVLRWGYLMRRTDATRIYTLIGPAFKSGGPGAVSRYYKVVMKERARATPFGFGITEAQFTAQQWAILAALGLTKADRIAR